MKILTLFFLLLFAHTTYSQTDSIVRYFKYGKNGISLDVETKDINQAVTRAVYYQQDGLWKMESRFFSTGRLFMTASYADAKATKSEGAYVSYHQNGKIKVKTFYLNNEENGLRQSWHENGLPKDSFLMSAGILVGKGFSWDTAGNIVAAFDLDDKGTGTVSYFKSNHTPISKGNRVKGKREGDWTFYADEGFKEWEVVYSQDSVLSFNCFGPDGKPKEGCVFEREAAPVEGTRQWKIWLAREIEKHGYPSRKTAKRKTAAELSGEVRVRFIVDKDGSIIDAEVIKSLNEEADKIALQVILSAPKWSPGIQRNRYVKSYRTQPITFTIPN